MHVQKEARPVKKIGRVGACITKAREKRHANVVHRDDNMRL